MIHTVKQASLVTLVFVLLFEGQQLKGFAGACKQLTRCKIGLNI